MNTPSFESGSARWEEKTDALLARRAAGDEGVSGEPHIQFRWAWWLMICAFAVGCTLLVVNWVGWQNLSVAARLIVLVELFLVACLVLFLVLGERFAEWAGYGSLWTTDELTEDMRDGVGRSDRNWSRTAQLKQYLRRTYYEVRCQQSSATNWRRTLPAAVSPPAEKQRQNPPLREPLPQRTSAVIAASPQPPLKAASTLTPPSKGAQTRPSVEIPEAPALEATPARTDTLRTCRPTSRLEIRRRQ